MFAKIGRSASRSLRKPIPTSSLSIGGACPQMLGTTFSREFGTTPFEFKTLTELQQNACKAYGPRNSLGTRVGSKYEWITYNQLDEDVSKFRTLLRNHKIQSGDKVGIISNNRREWVIAKYATVSLGAQLVPMYEAQLEKDWKYIINDSDMKTLLVSTEAVFEKANPLIGKVGKVESIICFDAPADKSYSFKGLMEKATPSAADPKVMPDDVCMLIYTSGTTGNPKGVELTHNNMVSNIKDGIDRGDLSNETSLAFLPWAHVFGLTVELHTMLATGGGLAIVPHRDQILECLAIAKPTIIMSVPMLFNRVYDGVMQQMASHSGLKRMLFNHAMKVARKRNHLLEFHQPVGALLEAENSFFDKLVFSKIREKLGGNLRIMTSGGAQTSPKVLQFFEDIGVPVLEGYGLTETSPVIAASGNGWENRRLGTVGPPLKSYTVRIMDPVTFEEMPPDTDGEITCAGPSVMKGYRNNAKANEEVFYERDGKKFFRTGDLGQLVEGKFLKITGRIKEQYKLLNGKYVVPAPLEDVMNRSPFIQQSFLYGDNKKYNVALIVPNMVNVAAWIEKNKDGVAKELMGLLPTKEELANPALCSINLFKKKAFRNHISSELARVTETMKGYERPLVWSAILHPFSQENQMQTPKLSLRRNNIQRAYEEVIQALYTPEGIGKRGTQVEYKQ